MNNKSNKKVNINAVGVNSLLKKDFSDIKFLGTFREYQARVINNCTKHLSDKRLHVVASPGSGKTILGLELILMFNEPALILSPTIAIREQWRERFKDMFIPQNANIDDYFSCSLKEPKLLTSITYQGLYTSFRKIAAQKTASAQKVEDKAEDSDDIENEIQENYSGINILQIMEEYKISTICLDEAHHLRAEWQKALHEFVQNVQHKVTIVALTATPPYDSKKSEWDKYIAMCGPIDEEIFVPELVRANTLCPHQDYIYYNFPTENEISLIKKYNLSVSEAIKDVLSDDKFLEIITNSEFYKDPDEFEDELAEQPEFIKSLLSFLNERKIKPPKNLAKFLERDNRDVEWNLSTAEILFGSILCDDQFFDIKDREYVKSILSKHGVVEKNKVCLTSNSELEKLLFSSTGKLNSISAIVDEEWKNLGDKIRLLVLTDYIKVNSSVLGSNKEISELGVIPIFELLRRKNLGLKLAVISGRIIIVPSASLEDVNEIANRENARIKVVPINGTEHVEVRFEGSNNSQKIAVITKAFNAGILNAIVGTKSLLGEGWDSPVINSLILASCVGSFMLSNQMRGRAIRIDKNCPDKVSNIWHLTAIMPPHLMPDVGDIPPSADYATMERRFHGFMGVCQKKDVIESSLDRANTLTAPYDENNVRRANEKTFSLARNRNAVREDWQQALAKSSNEVLIQNEIPKPKKGFIPALILRPSHLSTIRKTVHAVIKSFKDLSLINKKAKPIIEKDYTNKKINVGIARCSQYEKSIFHQAIAELLSPIDNPKYILVKTKRAKLDYRGSFAVPEVFSNKKENAEIFTGRMSRRIAKFELLFTRSNDGKKSLIMAKRKAYINKSNNEIQSKMKLKEK